jgi:RNA polymerase sigma-70 factor, ECF subfamily
MLAVARLYVKTWLGVLKGLDGFEGRSTLKTWILRILVNTAVLRWRRERRSVPFSAVATDGRDEPDVARTLARSERAVCRTGAAGSLDWRSLPEGRLLGRESVEAVREAIAKLPGQQQRVIAMRDVAGFSAQEACETLGISAANQRVLLHRARLRVRAAVESHIHG